MPTLLLRQLLVVLVFLLLSVLSNAQTQDDFNKKLADIYANASDKTKALALAKSLYDMVEKSKDLKTYANYYLLKTVFEVQAPDKQLAKEADEKATAIIHGSMASTNPDDTTANPFSRWFYGIYPALFSNKDPDIGSKALAFVERYPEYRSYDNYYYIAYAFERTGDYTAARQQYEKAMSLDTSTSPDTYRTYLYYTNFLSRAGDYLKAEEYIQKMERKAVTAVPMFRDSYKAEAMGARVVYYLNLGDYHSYIQASEANNTYSAALWHKTNTTGCDPYPGIYFTTAAFGREMLKEYDAAERLWKSRDSVNTIWVTCHNKTWPNNQYYPISMYPVYLVKRGKANKLPRPASYYIRETETHYNSYSQYADISINFSKATQLAWLGDPRLDELFRPLMQQVRNNRNFRESTLPFSNYAYFTMRSKRYEEARTTYTDLFRLNIDWINDVIFSFGEKAFATYYNAKLKEGYENFHSFVKLAKEQQPQLYPELARQAYNNLLFTKSISLKGIEKRKEAFLNSNDKNIEQLYEQWLEKKQQLIRQYLKADQPGSVDTTQIANQVKLHALQDTVNHLENELTTKARDFKKYLKIIPPDWKTIRDQLKKGEAAIEMIRFEWRNQVYYSDTVYYAAYIVTPGCEYPEVVYLQDDGADLENRYYKQYKNSIRLKIDDRESYRHFWKPVADYLATLSSTGNVIQKIYFSPDGIYHLINLATLKHPESGRYLLDDLDINYTASNNDGNENAPEPEIKTAALFGRPLYETSTASSVPVADPSTRSLVKNFRDFTPGDLPGTEEEVLTIGKTMTARNIKVDYFLKEKATEDKLYRLHSPDLVHIATHGYWSPSGATTDGYRTFNAMANSGLLFSGVVNYYRLPVFPDTYDGILTAYEAQTLDLKKTSLVILSACETGLGDLDAGEGVYGLQRAFLAAGSAAVMTSLWKVDDAATRDFMTTFISEWLATHDKKSAFIRAQKAMRDKYRQPYYWGAFIMMGK